MHVSRHRSSCPCFSVTISLDALIQDAAQVQLTAYFARTYKHYHHTTRSMKATQETDTNHNFHTTSAAIRCCTTLTTLLPMSDQNNGQYHTYIVNIHRDPYPSAGILPEISASSGSPYTVFSNIVCGVALAQWSHWYMCQVCVVLYNCSHLKPHLYMYRALSDYRISTA